MQNAKTQALRDQIAKLVDEYAAIAEKYGVRFDDEEDEDDDRSEF